MKASGLIALTLVALVVLPVIACGGEPAAAPTPTPMPATTPAAGVERNTIIDHTCLDIEMLPSHWVEHIKTSVALHYAHTSHGEQLIYGAQIVEAEDPDFAISLEECDLPVPTASLSVMDGMPPLSDRWCETYVGPEYYWDSPEGTTWVGDALAAFDIDVSMWCWCCQQDDNSADDTQRYLNAMSALEAAHPDVTFVYFTGNAQSASDNRYARNEQIR